MKTNMGFFRLWGVFAVFRLRLNGQAGHGCLIRSHKAAWSPCDSPSPDVPTIRRQEHAISVRAKPRQSLVYSCLVAGVLGHNDGLFFASLFFRLGRDSLFFWQSPGPTLAPTPTLTAAPTMTTPAAPSTPGPSTAAASCR